MELYKEQVKDQQATTVNPDSASVDEIDDDKDEIVDDDDEIQDDVIDDHDEILDQGKEMEELIQTTASVSKSRRKRKKLTAKKQPSKRARIF